MVMRAGFVVAVVMLVPVEGQCATGAGAEQRAVFRRGRHDVGRAFATDMTIETDHPVRGRHHHMQLVADHQDGASGFLTHLLDLKIEGGGAGLVQPLGGFVEQKQIGLVDERARKKNALELAPRQGSHLAVREVGHTGPLKRLRTGRPRGAPGQTQEPFHSDRQGRVDVQLLGDVADAQPRLSGNPSG